MKVGDYVRTKNYGICKITDIYNEDKIELDKINAFGIKGVCYSIENIIKSSPNIIDLIEVGDYVNEQLVMEIYEKNSIYKGSSNYKFKERTLELFNTDYECIPHEFLINNKRIESILTKEQFNSMEYKVGE